MKKKIIAIYLFIFINFSFFAEEKFSFEFTLSNNLQLGQAYEFVLSDKLKNNGQPEIMSRLDWPLLPGIAFNASIEFLTIVGFHAFFSTNFSVPSLKTGTMKDRDYENAANPDMLTRFSEHDCVLKKGLEFNVKLGWLMPLFKETRNHDIRIYVEPILGFHYYNYNWLASDGYTQYSNPTTPVTPETPITQSPGPAAEYNQKIYLPNIGLGLKIKFPKKWQLNSLVQICPQVLADCIDNHFGKNIIFNDIFILKGVSFHFNLSLEKEIKTFFSLFFLADYSAIRSLSGYTKYYNFGINTGTSPLYNAGTELYLSTYSLGVKFKYSKK